MKILAIVLLVLAAAGATETSTAAESDTQRPGGFSIALGSDWTHGMSTPSQKKMLDLRYFGSRWPHWSVSLSTWGRAADNTTALCTELYQTWRRLYAGFGPCLKNNEDDDVVSGDFAYQIRLGYRFRNVPRFMQRRGVKAVSAEILHLSNCSSALNNIFDDYCGVPWLPRGDRPNQGYNFGTLRLEGRWFQ